MVSVSKHLPVGVINGKIRSSSLSKLRESYQQTEQNPNEGFEKGSTL
jgi:hypothetical protein